MSALAAELARHISHRLTTPDGTRLRCWDCSQSIDLRPALTALPGSTSTSPRDPTPEQTCPHHIGEWADRCGRCRADQLEAAEPRPAGTPTADLDRARTLWQTELAQAKARRTQTDQESA